MERLQNLRKVEILFTRKLMEMGYEGVIGVAAFKNVYGGLMPIQRAKLEDICSKQFRALMREGSIICIGIAYPEHAIDCIGARLNNGKIDKNRWNTYAEEYHKINRFLNAIAEEIADFFDGIPIQATIEGITVKNIEDYYGMTISHRVVAENAGLGWRGKNELVVNEKFSCAIRFASIITDLP